MTALSTARDRARRMPTEELCRRWEQFSVDFVRGAERGAIDTTHRAIGDELAKRARVFIATKEG